MAAVISGAEKKLTNLIVFAKKDRKHAFISGLVIYTLFFSLYGFISLFPFFEVSGTILGGDGVAQYYPLLVAFRRDLSQIFGGILNGNPVFPMFDANFAFGTDAFASVAYDYLPFLPYYIFSVFVPESGLAFFYGMGTVLFAYVSGISFLYLCSYFEKDTVAAGFFAPFYALCGNGFYTAFFNQHFLIMFITFPLLIVGIDKVIRRRGFKLFVLSTAWLTLGGIPFLVYTVPFVVLFAFIRVYYVYGKHYFKELLPAFAKGLGAFILGLCLAGVLLLPALDGLLSGNRLSDSSRIFGSEMFMPHMQYLSDMLVPYDAALDNGICVAAIPFVILTLVRKRRSSELKCYLLVMMLFIALPVIRYGLNGFSYDMCRWGFIPAMLMCFICVSECTGDEQEHKMNFVGFAVISVIYLILITLKAESAAIIVLIAAGLMTAVPFLRRFTEFLSDKIKSAANRDERTRGLFKAAVLIIAVVAALVSLFLMIFTKCNFYLAVIIACLSVPTAYLTFSAKRELRYITGSLLAVILTVSSVMYFRSFSVELAVPDDVSAEEAAIRKSIAELSENDDTFGRIYAEHGTDEDQMATELGYRGPVSVSMLPDPHIDDALRYDIPDIYIFGSIVNNDLISFMRECGQDAASVFSVVNLNGFGTKEALYSLFGVRYLYLPYELDRFYGAESFDTGGAEGSLYPYINKYALPAGVTYSDTMSAERFASFDMATLPYAVLNEVYLDGADTVSSSQSDAVYSRRCDITHEKTSRGAVENYNECYDNTVTINEDTSGCFLYLSFENVNAIYSKGYEHLEFIIETDTGARSMGNIHNSSSFWQWKYSSDKYCIPLGYFDEKVSTLEFITPFEYDTLYVSAVPAEVYTNAYEKITAEKAENMTLLPNAMECDITVSSDKVLCINTMYSKGWKAFVDGESVPVYKANGLFVGLPLKAGSHSIRIEYVTPKLIEGVILSISALAVLITLSVVIKKRQKKK